MKTRVLILPAISIVLILTACNCKAFNLSSASRTATPSPPQPRVYQDAVTPSPPPSISINAAPFIIPWNDRSLFRKRLTTSYQGILDGLPGASMYHLAFSLSNPPASIKGVEEVRYTNQEKSALTEVDFAIFSEILGGSLQISNIRMDGQTVTPIFSTGLMRVPLAVPLEPGRSITFHMEFSIAVPTQGGDFYYGIFGYNNGTLSLAHAYPTILVYDEMGWNNQMPDLEGDPLFSDASFYLVSIDAPADLTLVTSGVEVNRQESAGRQKILYADGPARDFYLAASNLFIRESEKVGEITYNSFTPASLSQYARSALETAQAAINDFNQRYGPYPYTEFNIVPITTSASGVEFPGMTALSEKVYSQNSYLEAVLTHEVSHQWFYNLVGNETQQQPWLDESLAQFATCQYYRDRYGSQAQQSCMDSMKARWENLDDQKIPIGEPVSAYTNDAYGAIVYGRGPLFFMALSDQIGQAAFDNLMRGYVKTFAWDIATTDSFKRLAEQHCGCNLTPLFQEWVYP
jgi:hypothetical protein